MNAVVPPKGWVESTLGKLATIERTTVQPEEIQTGTRYVGLEHITSEGQFIEVPSVEAGELASNKFAFNDEHLLYGKLRPYLKKIARPIFSGICSTDILPILPSPKVDRSFLYYYLRQPSYIDLATTRSTGANLPRLSPKALAEFSVFIPPLEEQRRIAAILDKADAVRRKRKEAIALTEELLRSAFLEMFGDPVTNPKGCEVKPLDEVLDVLHRYPTFYGCEYIETGVPVLKIGSIGEDYIIDRNLSSYDKVTPEFSAQFPKTVVKQNDLVMAVRGDTTGKIGLVPPELVGANISPNLIRLSPCSELCVPQYLFWVFRCGQALIEGRINDTAKKSLTAMTLREVPIPLPPKPKQDEFERIFEQAMSMRSRQQSVGEKNEQLFNSLLQRAFRGEL